MNRISDRRLRLVLLAAIAPAAFAASVSNFINHRFYPDAIQVRDVQGIAERIINNKLTLSLRSFLELVLRNSTDINIARMDVYSSADQVKAAHAVFDPIVSM